MVTVEDHVDALKGEALVVILEGENALAAQNARPFFLHEVLDPREELVGVERPFRAQRDRLHLLVVIVLQPAAIVMMAVSVVMPVIMVMIVIVCMVVPVALQELGLDLQDAVEVERVAAEDLGQRDPAALGPVQPWHKG